MKRYLSSKISQNLTEKIVQKYAVDLPAGHVVRSGDFLSIRPHHIMTHDNTAAVMKKFVSLGCTKFNNSSQPVFAIDHDIQNKSNKNLEKYESIRNFAQKYKVDFYPAGTGIGHQIVIEQGYAFPNTLVVASDSHSNVYGGIGCLGTPVVRTDAAAIWATGKTWWQVPKVVKVMLDGKLPSGLSGKDIIVALCGLFNNDEVLNMALEFDGEGVSGLPIDDRLAIANMTTEWGAVSGLFPVDHRTLEWLKYRAKKLDALEPYPHVPSLQNPGSHPRINSNTIYDLEKTMMKADDRASYHKTLHLDLNTLREDFVAGPNSVKVASPISKLVQEHVIVNKGYLVSCANSRLSDLKDAADVLREYEKKNGRPAKISNGVEFYIAAASAEIEKGSKQAGDWDVLLKAGAIPLPSGCGPCIGLGIGLLQDGEVGISATNRNFKGRMGSRNAKAYLASPKVVAMSVLNGFISSPNELSGGITSPLTKIEESSATAETEDKIDLIDGFPSSIEGDLLFCGADNLNTDGIYPGKYTYNDNLTPKEMAKVVMENYDPEFTKKARSGDILVSGKNFGSGSSREQAATALKYAGIKVVIAASFSETYKRNAFNNGVICAESEPLITFLQDYKSKGLTVRTGLKARLDFQNSRLHVETDKGKRSFSMPRLGEIAQKLIVKGGLEEIIKSEI